MLVALASFCLPAGAVLAQEAEVCPDGRIASITVVRYPIFGDGESRDSVTGFTRAMMDVADWVHVESKESLIRRELLFEEGDCVNRLRLTESERLLRQFRFLESVTVESEARPDGDVDVTVTTTDDWSLRLEPRFNFGEGFAFGGVSLGETNLSGRGRTLELAYLIREGDDDWLLRYFDPQAFATRWDLELAFIRGKPGWIVQAALAYPFVGLVGNWAAYQNFIYAEDDFRYFVGDRPDGRVEVRLPTLRRTFGVGGALRSRGAVRGRSTRLASYGILASYESSQYGTEALDDSLSTLLDSIPAIGQLQTDAMLESSDALRLSLVGGLRALDYVQRRGVVTMQAVEDIPLGAAVDALAGVAPEWFGRPDSHALFGAALYGGSRVAGTWFSILQANGEVRRDLDAGRWRDAYVAARWVNVWKWSEAGANEFTVFYSAGWQTTVPFQLTLGGPERLTGYTFDRYPGGERLTARLENRHNLVRVGRLFDLGSVINVDVGRMWANDALFGVDSGTRGSLGIGLRFAAPAGSRQTYRLIVGIPFERDLQFSHLVISFSIDRLLQIENRRRPLDPQLARSRDPAILDASTYLK
jgi:hypothetical protein